jgi:NAD(P)H-dependent FMN reductase
MPLLQIIVGSTRPVRAGEPIAAWFHGLAREVGTFETELLDLAEIDLPFLNERAHPRLQKYEHPKTQAWSSTIARGDAYVMVTPEYNHSFPAALKNAIDFLHAEWRSKPVGFVSYGGISGGTRAVHALKPVVTALGMVAVPEAVNVGFFSQRIKDGRFDPAPETVQAGHAMLGSLLAWAKATEPLRAPAGEPGS